MEVTEILLNKYFSLNLVIFSKRKLKRELRRRCIIKV